MGIFIHELIEHLQMARQNEYFGLYFSHFQLNHLLGVVGRWRVPSSAAVPRSNHASSTLFRGKIPSSADSRRSSCQLLAK